MGCAGCESKALSLLGHCGGVKLVFCLFMARTAQGRKWSTTSIGKQREIQECPNEKQEMLCCSISICAQ